MTKRMLSMAALAVLLTITAAYAQKITTDSDPAANFAAYRTYAWTTGTPSSNPLGEQRIHDGVNGQLAAKGLKETATMPDLYVATHLLTHEEQQIVSNGFGYGAWWGGGSYTTSVHTYIKGTLIVDLYDASTKKMVWRGTAMGTASSKPAKNADKVREALGKIFERYPGGSTASR